MPALVAWYPEVSPNDLSGALDLVVARDPFRMLRHPSPIAFGAEALPQTQPTPPRQLPPLTLAGIVGGPPWRAVLEGVPGRDAPVVVQRGDSVAGVRVRMVERDYVIVAGMDTVWRLALKRTWR
jgi:hypothetical protein